MVDSGFGPYMMPILIIIIMPYYAISVFGNNAKDRFSILCFYHNLAEIIIT